MLKLLFDQLRINNWIKNLIIFLPIFFNQSINLDKNFLLLILWFFSLSFLSSSSYCINDILDIEYDKLHENKKNRPFSKWIINIKSLIIIIFFLIIFSFLIGFLINIYFFYLLILYLLLTTFYSIIFKNIIIFEILIIVSLYFLRLYSWWILTSIELSNNLVLITIFISWFLIVWKRLSEKISQNKIKRYVVEKYNNKLLYFFFIILWILSNLEFIFFLINKNINLGIWIIYFFIIYRYIYRIHYKINDEDIINNILKDKIILVLTFLLFIIIFINLY